MWLLLCSGRMLRKQGLHHNPAPVLAWCPTRTGLISLGESRTRQAKGIVSTHRILTRCTSSIWTGTFADGSQSRCGLPPNSRSGLRCPSPQSCALPATSLCCPSVRIRKHIDWFFVVCLRCNDNKRPALMTQPVGTFFNPKDRRWICRYTKGKHSGSVISMRSFLA